MLNKNAINKLAKEIKNKIINKKGIGKYEKNKYVWIK